VNLLKILQIIPYFSAEFGGSAEACYQLSKSLATRGHEVRVFTTRAGKYWFDELAVHRYPILLSLAQFNITSSDYECSQLCAWADVIHMHNFRTFQNVQAMNKGKTYVLQPHGSLPNAHGKRALKSLFDRVWGKKLLRGAASVITVNSLEAMDAIAAGVSTKRIAMIPNGVNLADFADLPSPNVFRQKYGLGASQVVLFLGRLHKGKGIELLLHTITVMTNTKLVIVGPDAGYRRQLAQYASYTGVGDSVVFTGALYGDAKREALAAVDVVAIPSYFETFPLVALEAWACSLPVVIRKGSGIDYLVNQAGVVAGWEGDSMEVALRQALEHKTEYGRAGRALVESEFTWDAVVDKVEQVYERCLNQ